MSLAARSPLKRAPDGAPIRVVLIDDSAVVRGLARRWFETESDIEIAGLAVDGEDGVRKVAEHKPEVIILDVEMPRLDGLSALPAILKAAPGARVIMASTLTQRNADVTMKALAAGASDYLPKPETGRLAGADQYRRDLLYKIRELGAAGRKRAASGAHKLSAPPPRLVLKKASATRPAALFIGSSTGGPQALRSVISALGGRVKAPIFITQHMPATFTTILAEHIGRESSAAAVEAADGMPVRAGTIYVAPGDYHMTVKRRAGGDVISLDQRPPENFCRPSVDVLFRSAAERFGPEALGVVLTGMGHDGRDGSAAIAEAGGSIIAQDEATSVIWGMPGAVARAGVASSIKPLNEIGAAIMSRFSGRPT